MRLITHNFLICNVKACVPRQSSLRIHPTEVTHIPTEMKPEVLQKFIGRIDWPLFRQTAGELGESLPETMGEAEMGSTEVMQAVHKLLLDVKAM